MHLAVFSFVRMTAWLWLMACYGLGYVMPGFHWTRALFASLPFVALISLYANSATDYGAGSANLAEYTAGDAHSDAEHAREQIDVTHRQLGRELDKLDADIARLSALHPGEEADRLQADIRARLVAVAT